MSHPPVDAEFCATMRTASVSGMCHSPAKTSNAIQAGEPVRHCTAANPMVTIRTDAPGAGLGIALPSDFDRAAGLLALTFGGGGNRRSGLKQIERAYEGEQKLRWHN